MYNFPHGLCSIMFDFQISKITYELFDGCMLKTSVCKVYLILFVVVSLTFRPFFVAKNGFSHVFKLKRSFLIN